MRVYARVVEQGSFARAADSLEISRPAATAAVAQLERRLGVRLLHRTTRRLSLTEDGRACYERCVRVLGDIAEMEDSLTSSRASPRGRLRVSTPSSFVRREFFPALPRFLAKHPGLEIEIVMTDRVVNMVEEGIDCAVRAAEIPDDSSLVARRIAGVPWLTCASRGYIAARGLPETVADLALHNGIRFVSPSTGRASEWQFRSGDERVAFTPQGNLGVNSFEAAVAAALAGIGIAQIPLPLGVPALDSGELLPLLLDWTATAPPMALVYPSNRYLSSKVRAFADFVSEIFPADAWTARIEELRRGRMRERSPKR